MKYKKILFALLLFIFPTIVLTSCSNSQPVPRSDKPNIIIILTDDQPYHTIEHMPTVQSELVQNGITFTNAYATTPLCCPSRASILTGQYVFHHGVQTNRQPNGGATVFKDSSTLPVWLQEADYQTALIGKYLNDYDALPEGYVPPGWNEWNVFDQRDVNRDFYFSYTLNENGTIKQYGDDDYSTDVLRDKAVDFIQDNSHQPFFLLLSLYSPHQPYLFAKRHQDLFKSYNDLFSPYQPLNYFEEDITDKPQWLSSFEPQEKDYVEKVYQRMLRSLMGADDAVASVIETLEDENIRQNTVIIFMSDNGFALGDHRLIGKACPYEICLHVPLVISYPDKIPASRLDSNMVLTIDIAPTLMQLAGAPIPSTVDGQSFTSLITNPSEAWRDGFLIEQYEDDGEERSMVSRVPAYVGFRTNEWKYIEYVTGEQELYNLLTDPYEMNNLAGLAEYDSVIQEMQQRIDEIRNP
jgi:N-acetylglucosamine-6-sulfatase